MEDVKDNSQEKYFNFLPISEMRESRIFYELTIPPMALKVLFTIFLMFFFVLIYIFFGNYDYIVRAPAQIRATEEIAHITPLISGKLKEKCFSSGQFVQKDATLYILENSHIITELKVMKKQKTQIQNMININEYVLSVLENYETNKLITENNPTCESEKIISSELKKLELEVSKAKSDYERELALFPSFTSKQSVENYKKIFNTMELNLKSYTSTQKKIYLEERNSKTQELNEIISTISKLEKDFSNTIIKSPVTGYVEELFILAQDENVIAETQIAKVIPLNKGKIKANIQISIEDIADLKPNMEFTLSFPKYPSSEYTSLKGYIDFIPKDSKLLQNGSAIYQVTGIIDSDTLIKRRNGNKVVLVPGMNATCKIITRTEPLYLFILEKLGI